MSKLVQLIKENSFSYELTNFDWIIRNLKLKVRQNFNIKQIIVQYWKYVNKKIQYIFNFIFVVKFYTKIKINAYFLEQAKNKYS